MAFRTIVMMAEQFSLSPERIPNINLSLRILNPNEFPYPGPMQPTENPLSIRLGFNDVLFRGRRYREIDPHERHIFNMLLLMRDTGLSWSALQKNGLHLCSTEPLQFTDFRANMHSLSGKLTAIAGKKVIFETKETQTYNLHPAFSIEDGRADIRRTSRANADSLDEKRYARRQIRRPKQAAIKAIVDLFSDHPRCTQMLREFKKSGKACHFRVPNHEEMQDLFITLNHGIQIMLEFAQDGWNPTVSQEKALIEAAAAYHILIYGHQGLVHNSAANHTPGISFDDRIQMGNIGLMRAIEYFDPKRGYAFSTLAVTCIRRHISNEQGKERPINLPEYANYQLGTLRQEAKNFFSEYGREATPKELSARMDLSLEEVSQLLVSGTFWLPSLNVPKFDEKGGSRGEWGESFADTSQAIPNEIYCARQKMERIFEISTLTIQEKLALSLHYGVYISNLAHVVLGGHTAVREHYADCFEKLLGTKDGLTPHRIGEVLGLRSAEVKHILKEAMKKIRAVEQQKTD